MFRRSTMGYSISCAGPNPVIRFFWGGDVYSDSSTTRTVKSTTTPKTPSNGSACTYTFNGQSIAGIISNGVCRAPQVCSYISNGQTRSGVLVNGVCRAPPAYVNGNSCNYTNNQPLSGIVVNGVCQAKQYDVTGVCKNCPVTPAGSFSAFDDSF